MALDLNQAPYFDDFSEDDLFHRILFKPGVAVQARELTQLQTILQNQIERFGSHIFKNGSRVLGGQFDPQDPIPYVRVELASSTTRTALIGKELTGVTTGMKARVIHAEADPEEVGVSVLFIRYTNEVLSGGITTTEFTVESLTYVDDDSNTQTLSTTSVNTTGTGSIFGISEGVLFTQGFFVKFDSQKIALDPFNSAANKRVYFKTEFSIVDSDEDPSLLDNAQGFNNYNAPGADRLKCELTLVVSELTEDLSDQDHTLLIEVRDGAVYEKQERTQYNEIYDEIAKRTYDESGDYVVRGWDVISREHLNDGTNGGLLTAAEGGDANKLSIGLEKGLAYVKGYEVETLTTRYMTIDKATEYDFIDEQYSLVQVGNYTEIDEIVGLPDPDRSVSINLYDAPENRVTNITPASNTAQGSTIGTAQISSYTFHEGDLGTPNGTIRLFLHNIVMNSGYSFADVRSLGNSDFFADTVLSSGRAVLQDTSINSKLYYVGSGYTRSVTDEAGSPDMTIVFSRETTGSVLANGTYSSISLNTNESLPYGTGALDAVSKETIFLVVTAAGGVNTSDLAGTVTANTTSNTVAGSGTSFTNLNAGDNINIDGNIYQISAINSDTSLELTTTPTADVSANTYSKHYQNGALIDLNSKGADNGLTRTVTTTTSTLSIDLDETFGSPFDAKLIYRVKKEPVSYIPKLLRPNRYVKLTGDGSTKKFYLGFSDIYSVKEVRLANTAFTSNTDGENVSSAWSFNDGQTETSYETGYIETTGTAPASGEYLLVRLDYFEPDFSSGQGYFCIDSYPIDDANTSSTSIKTINLPAFKGVSLRNFIDTRPIKANTATDATTVGTASSDPAKSTSYEIDTHGLRTPVPGSSLIFDYSYYLARRDALVVNGKGVFSIISGTAAKVPAFPKVSDNYMKIANLYIPPYPSLSYTYARILGNPQAGVAADKVTFSRYTMRDIGKIKKRVKDLEYYNALNLIEKNTLDLTIPDENGLDRFKNGVFVDPFADHSLADGGNPDYAVAIDKRSKEARPTYTVDGFDTGYFSGTNVVKNDNLVTLPFSEVTLIDQPYATTTRNIEFSSYRFIGVLHLDPDSDTWCDTTTVDKTIDLESDIPVGKTVTTEWGAPEIHTTGAVSGTPEYKVYLRYKDEGDNDEHSRGLTSTEIANRLGISGTPREIDTIPNLYAALTPSELSARYRGTFSSMAAADKYIKSLPGDTVNKRYFVVSGGQVVTTETVTETYTGIETTVNVEEDLTEIGSFVTDATIIPYIRPQIIKLTATGLKRSTRYHIFFDDQKMNDYVTPCKAAAAQYDEFPIVSNISPDGAEGDPVYSDEFGNVVCWLRLPSGNDKRFRTGQSEVVVTDSPTNDPESTSYAEATFISAGLNLQKQNTILSTKTSTQESRVVTRTETYTQTRVSNTPQQFKRYGGSCMAYSFYVDVPEGEEGVFLSSVDVWISALSETLGVWFEIREMSNDGNITRNQVPYSEVWMYRNDSRLNISTDGITNSTTVDFKAPVFLLNKTQYAFLIHSEGLNPDTYFWISRLGGTDVSTELPVTSRPLTGTTYTTNNNLNWDIVPDVDMKIRFNRASFTESSGTATFVNEDVEFITANTALPSTFFNNGEPIRSSEILQLSLASANAAIGDYIVDQTSGANSVIVDISGTNYYVEGFDYITGANVEILASSNTAIVKDTGEITSVNFGTGIIDNIDRPNIRFDITHSNGKFFVGCVLRSLLPERHKTVRFGESELTYTDASSTIPNPFAPSGTMVLPVGAATSNTTITAPSYTIEQFTTFDYTSMLFRPSYLDFNDTSVSFSAKTRTQANNTVESTAKTVIPNDLKEHLEVKTILSRSVEVADYSGTKSFQMTVNLGSSSTYISPVVDASLMGGVFQLNSLNNDTTGETASSGGNLNSKYLSKVVTLDEDNEAEDLLVLLNEYRPATSDIVVWARFKSRYDQESIYDKEWLELDVTKNAVSSTVNKKNYIETTYQIPAKEKTGTFNELEYPFVIDADELVANTEYTIVSTGNTDFTAVGAANNDVGTTFTANNSTGGTGTVRLSSDVVYTGYNQFQIKIGFKGTNKAIYPKVAQLRAIALQV